MSTDVEPHLYITEREPAKYATLSHCWGGNSPITTTTDTIKERKRKIPLDELPKTFKDAVIITRNLGLEHIWIDSLCILQDSTEDWEREAGNMSEIYTNCYVMIAADDASNCHGGCFIPKDSLNQRSFSLECPGQAERPRRHISDLPIYGMTARAKSATDCIIPKMALSAALLMSEVGHSKKGSLTRGFYILADLSWLGNVEKSLPANARSSLLRRTRNLDSRLSWSIIYSQSLSQVKRPTCLQRTVGFGAILSRSLRAGS
jgi:hypothetical protein